MNYYNRNIGDIARDLSHLSQGAIGAYDLLMDWYYANEKPLPSDPEDIYNITRARTKDEKRNAAKARAFFDAEGRHARCDEEIAKYRARAETNRAIAVQREETKRSTKGARDEHESCSVREPNQEPITKKKERKSKATPPSATAADDLPAIPEWINPEAWAGFVAMRKRERHPLTRRAAELVLRKLDVIRANNEEPNEALDQSTRNSWRDVYAPRRGESHGSTATHRESASERVARNNAEAEKREAVARGALDRAA